MSTETYSDYLVEEQEKQTNATVPVTSNTGTSGYADYLTKAYSSTVSAGSDYGKWLQTMANNYKVENTPTNAKTYSDYLLYLGQDPIGDYNAKVRQANLEYARGLATYGQLAEKMAQSGLTGSGYGEYLTSEAYAQRAKAITTAQQTAGQQMKQAYVSYGDYVAGLQAQQTAQTTVDATELANATNAVSSAMQSGLAIDAAIASLNGVYSAAALAQVKTNLQNQNNQQYTASINAATGVSNYKAGLDQQLATGAITQDTYNAQLQAGYDKNYEFVQKALDSSDFSGLAEYAKDNNLTLETGNMEQVASIVDHMTNAGALTGVQRQHFYYTSKMDSYNDEEYSPQDAVNEIEKVHELFSSGKISESQRNGLMSLLGNKMGTVEVTSAESSYNIMIEYKQNGKSEFIYMKPGITGSNKVDGSGFVAGKVVNFSTGDYSKVVFGTINGRLAYQITMTDGTVQYLQAKKGTPDYLNTAANAAFVAYMMVP